MNEHYILKDGEVCDVTLMEWATWFETAERHVARTERDGVVVSTVFLGLDHSFGAPGPPVLWETMVFGGALDGEQDRYTSRADAERGHEAMAVRVWAE